MSDTERLAEIEGRWEKTNAQNTWVFMSWLRDDIPWLIARVRELGAQAARDATVRAAAANAIGHKDWGGFTNHVLDNLSDDWVLPVVEALYELEAVVAPLLEEGE